VVLELLRRGDSSNGHGVRSNGSGDISNGHGVKE
jgi:hypothetical protein